MRPGKRIVLVLIAVMAPAVGLALPSVEDDEWVDTAPRQLLHDMPFTLGLSVQSIGDCDPASRPTASVNGKTIRVDLSDDPLMPCDALAPRTFLVEVPGLPAGEYTVEVFSATVSSVRRTFKLQVQFAPIPPDIVPNHGFWTDQRRPGTGFYVQPRGDLLGLGLFEFIPQHGTFRDSDWRVVAAPLHGSEALFLLPRITDGSCLGCSPHRVPSEGSADDPVHLAFESARRARATLVDGTVVPLVSLPFGAAYVEAALVDTVDDEFGPLPLPDLAGRWFIDSPNGGVVHIGTAQVGEAGVVRFHVTGDDDAGQVIECSSASDESRAGCAITHHCCSPPARYGFAALGDITETRMRFTRLDVAGSYFDAVRLAPLGASGQ